MELFYWIKEDQSDSIETRLTIIAISEEQFEEELRSVSDLTTHFPRLYLRLPNGTHRIAIEGERSKRRKFCAISLDDVTIMDCDRFGKVNSDITLCNNAVVMSKYAVFVLSYCLSALASLDR